MNRFVSYIVVFFLGVIASAWVIKTWYGLPPGGYVSQGIKDSGPRISPVVARPGSNVIADAAAKIEKAVVNIDTVGRPAPSNFGRIEQFFGFPFGGDAQPVVPKGRASGVIISADGYIITNNHVVADARTVNVTLHNGKQYPAKIIGTDPKTDLAVIKISGNNFPYARIAESNNLRVGDWVVAVGNALGLGTTVTVGVISATQRGPLIIEDKVLENAIQTDAAINRGNSGGALADINGDLVGINTAIASTSPGGGSIGIGFAIPSRIAQRIADQLIKNGKVIRPWLGIRYQDMTDELRQAMRQQGVNPPAKGGVLVREVIAGSPADQAGIQPMDIILEIDGKKITNTKVVQDTISRQKVGQSIQLMIWHAANGQTGRIGVRLAEMPKDIQ